VKDLEDYDSPGKIMAPDKKQAIIPDIAAHYPEETNLYEVELDNKMKIGKWKMLLSYARGRNGHLFLVVPDYMKENVKKELRDNDFNAGLIYFKTD
jgi:hypothetical protein